MLQLQRVKFLDPHRFYYERNKPTSCTENLLLRETNQKI